MQDIPDDMIVNWDQTACIKYIPLSNWTMDKEGSKRVELAGVDDKRQITATFAHHCQGIFYLCSWCTRERQQSAIQLLSSLKAGI